MKVSQIWTMDVKDTWTFMNIDKFYRRLLGFWLEFLSSGDDVSQSLKHDHAVQDGQLYEDRGQVSLVCILLRTDHYCESSCLALHSKESHNSWGQFSSRLLGRRACNENDGDNQYINTTSWSSINNEQLKHKYEHDFIFHFPVQYLSNKNKLLS